MAQLDKRLPIPNKAQSHFGKPPEFIIARDKYKFNPNSYESNVNNLCKFIKKSNVNRIPCNRTKELLDDKGYKLLGTGCYAVVIECPWDESLAVKIGRTGADHMDFWEDGWLAWAGFCMKYQSEHGDNKFLPKIHGVHVEGDFFVAVIDKYEKTLNTYNYEDDYDEDINYHVQVISSIIDSPWLPDVHDSFFGEDVDELEKILGSDGCPPINDLHDENLMLTSNGHVVITDPTSSRCNGERTKDIFKELGLLKG